MSRKQKKAKGKLPADGKAMNRILLVDLGEREYKTREGLRRSSERASPSKEIESKSKVRPKA